MPLYKYTAIESETLLSHHVCGILQSGRWLNFAVAFIDLCHPNPFCLSGDWLGFHQIAIAATGWCGAHQDCRLALSEAGSLSTLCHSRQTPQLLYCYATLLDCFIFVIENFNIFVIRSSVLVYVNLVHKEQVAWSVQPPLASRPNLAVSSYICLMGLHLTKKEWRKKEYNSLCLLHSSVVCAHGSLRLL